MGRCRISAEIKRTMQSSRIHLAWPSLRMVAKNHRPFVDTETPSYLLSNKIKIRTMQVLTYVKIKKPFGKPDVRGDRAGAHVLPFSHGLVRPFAGAVA